MEIRFNLNPDALPTLLKMAAKDGIAGGSDSDVIKRWLHHLADVPLPTKGGSEKGRVLNLDEAARDARRANAAVARAARKSRKPVE